MLPGSRCGRTDVPLAAARSGGIEARRRELAADDGRQHQLRRAGDDPRRPQGHLARERTVERGDKSMANRLAAELTAASRGEGGAVKKKDDTHRMAEANKAFAHFRF